MKNLHSLVNDLLTLFRYSKGGGARNTRICRVRDWAFKKPPCFKNRVAFFIVMERFVTVNEFSLGWNPVRRCAQNRKILRQRENHVVCGGGVGAVFLGFEGAPYKRPSCPQKNQKKRN